MDHKGDDGEGATVNTWEGKGDIFYQEQVIFRQNPINKLENMRSTINLKARARALGGEFERCSNSIYREIEKL